MTSNTQIILAVIILSAFFFYLGFNTNHTIHHAVSKAEIRELTRINHIQAEHIAHQNKQIKDLAHTLAKQPDCPGPFPTWADGTDGSLDY